LAIALGALGVGASTASATFHLMQIREIYPGSIGHPTEEYVELQMWAAGQNLVGGKTVRIFNSAGTEVGGAKFPRDVTNGANQSTLVLATPEANAQFGIVADAEWPANTLDSGGGMICWDIIDCVSWGNFEGSKTSPSPSGTPALGGGIPDGKALRRSIARECPTLLEARDDTDNSAADFFEAEPNPRPNSVPPSEVSCSAPPKETPRLPQTKLHRKPAKRTHDRTPTFTFSASLKGSTFECSVDKRSFRRCRSPFTTKPLKPGPHRFRVRARSALGGVDRSPASYSFKVLPSR
jgi:hypothetical protein